MFRWLVTNLRTLLLAFALALAVWISAVTADDPDETRLYPNPVPIEYVGQDPALVVNETLPQDVQLTLRAPQSVWGKLESGENVIRAIVDLSGLKAGAHSVNAQIQISVRPVRVVSASPATLNLILEPLATRSLPVELSFTGKPAVGYQVGEAVPGTTAVTISGPESLISRVEHVYAVIDLSGVHQAIDTTVPLTAVDTNDIVVSGVTVHPESVHISLPISQLSGYRDLAVKVVPLGQPARGYRLASLTPFPLVVTVFASDPTLVNALPGYVETAPLDLTGASNDIETRLALNLPAGVTLVGEQTVLVQAGITPIEGSLTMSYRPVEVTNLATGLQANVSPQRVDVIFSGPLPVLDALSPSDVQVVVDASGLEAGTYQLTPTVQLMIKNITIESVLPGTVEVVISSIATPAP